MSGPRKSIEVGEGQDNLAKMFGLDQGPGTYEPCNACGKMTKIEDGPRVIWHGGRATFCPECKARYDQWLAEAQPKKKQWPEKPADLVPIGVDPRNHGAQPASSFYHSTPVLPAAEVSDLIQGAMLIAQRFEAVDRLNLNLEEFEAVRVELAAWLELTEKLKRA